MFHLGAVAESKTIDGWLNMAEIKLSVLARQCLDQRMAEFETLATEVAAWLKACHQKQSWIDWRFTSANAQVKLQRLNPFIHH